jgi:hypothetical protein
VISPASIRGLQSLWGVSPADVPYSDEELAAAHGAQLDDANQRARDSDATNLEALGPSGQAVNQFDRMQQQQANAQETGMWGNYLDRVTALPFAAANRGYNFKVLPGRSSTRALGGGK